MRHPLTGALLFLSLLGLVAIASCAQEDYPLSVWLAQHPGSPDASVSAVDAGETQGVRVCTQAHAESLPARLVAMSANATSGGSVVLVSDLFQRFTEVCGTCHGTAVQQGGFQIVTSTDFTPSMTADVLKHVTSSVCPKAPNDTDPDDPMPPCSSPNGDTYAQRSESDPVRQFAELVSAWLAAGRSPTFTPPSAPSATGADARRAPPTPGP